MKSKMFKNLIVGVMVGCLLSAGTAYAAETIDVPTGTATISGDSARSIQSKYMRSGGLSFSRTSSQVYINVSTKAYTKVDHIYHDVTVYKNGTWVSSDRYEDWNKVDLYTTIEVSASSGDVFDVYVDHYTDHEGCVEVMHSHEMYTY